MHRLILLATIAVIHTADAVPWVVLDSGSDMLAMSSEISDSQIAVVAPPKPEKNHKSTEEEDRDWEKRQPEERQQGQEKEYVPTTPPTTERMSPAAETLPLSAPSVAVVNSKESTTMPSVITTSETDQEFIESTTMKVGVMVESDLKHEDMNIQVVPESPNFPEQHPNSIEEDIILQPIIVITRKKHTGFNSKKQGYGF